MKEQFDKMDTIKIENPLYIDRQVEALLAAPNPYHLLRSKETLMEQQERLNGLHPDDRKQLILCIVANCPTSDLGAYSHLITQFIKPPEEVNSEESNSSDSALETPFFNALFNALKLKQPEKSTENDIDNCYSYAYLTHTNGLFTQAELRKRKLDQKQDYIVVDLDCEGIMNLEPEEVERTIHNNWCHLF